MTDSKINVIKPKSGFGMPDLKMSPKLVIFLTLVLAVVSIITATLLYNRRDEPVAPNAPIPAPAAGEMCGGIAGTACPTGSVCEYAGGSKTAPFPDASGTCVVDTATPKDLSCIISFTISATPTPTPTPTPTGTPTPTPSATPTPTPTPTPSGTPNSCNGTCGSNANCSGGMICDVTSGRCRNPSCLSDNDCGCDIITTPTPTPVTTPQPTPPTLTEAGSTFGTWTLSIAGAILATIGAIAIFSF